LDFVKPFDLIFKYNGFGGAGSAPATLGRKDKSFECIEWSSLLDEARTFFTENS